MKIFIENISVDEKISILDYIKESNKENWSIRVGELKVNSLFPLLGVNKTYYLGAVTQEKDVVILKVLKNYEEGLITQVIDLNEFNSENVVRKSFNKIERISVIDDGLIAIKVKNNFGVVKYGLDGRHTLISYKNFIKDESCDLIAESVKGNIHVINTSSPYVKIIERSTMKKLCKEDFTKHWSVALLEVTHNGVKHLIDSTGNIVDSDIEHYFDPDFYVIGLNECSSLGYIKTNGEVYVYKKYTGEKIKLGIPKDSINYNFDLWERCLNENTVLLEAIKNNTLESEDPDDNFNSRQIETLFASANELSIITEWVDEALEFSMKNSIIEVYPNGDGISFNITANDTHSSVFSIDNEQEVFNMFYVDSSKGEENDAYVKIIPIATKDNKAYKSDKNIKLLETETIRCKELVITNNEFYARPMSKHELIEFYKNKLYKEDYSVKDFLDFYDESEEYVDTLCPEERVEA